MLTHREVRVQINDKLQKVYRDVCPVVVPEFLKAIPDLADIKYRCDFIGEGFVLPDDIADKLINFYPAPVATSDDITTELKLSDFIHVRDILTKFVQQALHDLPQKIINAITPEIIGQTDIEVYKQYGYAAELKTGEYVVISPESASTTYLFGEETCAGIAETAEIRQIGTLKVVWPIKREIKASDVAATKLQLVLISENLQEKFLHTENLQEYNNNVKHNEYIKRIVVRYKEELSKGIVITQDDVIGCFRRLLFPQAEKASLVDKLTHSAGGTAAFITQTAGTRFAGTTVGKKRTRKYYKNEQKEWRLLESVPIPDFNSTDKSICEAMQSAVQFKSPSDFYKQFASSSILDRQGNRVFADPYIIDYTDGDSHRGNPENELATTSMQTQKIFSKSVSGYNNLPYGTISSNYYFFNRPRLGKYGGFSAPFIGYESDSRLLGVPMSGDFSKIIGIINSIGFHGQMHRGFGKKKKDKKLYDEHNRDAYRQLARKKRALDAAIERSYFTPYMDFISYEKVFAGQDPWSLDIKLRTMAYVKSLLENSNIPKADVTEEIREDAALKQKLQKYGWYKETDQDVKHDVEDSDVTLLYAYDSEYEKCKVYPIDNISAERKEEIYNIENIDEKEKKVADLVMTDNIYDLLVDDYFLRQNLYKDRVPLMFPDKEGLSALGVNTEDKLAHETKAAKRYLIDYLDDSAHKGHGYTKPYQDLMAVTGTEGYNDIKDSYMYFDALRFTNTISRSKGELEARKLENEALIKEREARYKAKGEREL